MDFINTIFDFLVEIYPNIICKFPMKYSKYFISKYILNEIGACKKSFEDTYMHLHVDELKDVYLQLMIYMYSDKNFNIDMLKHLNRFYSLGSLLEGDVFFQYQIFTLSFENLNVYKFILYSTNKWYMTVSLNENQVNNTNTITIPNTSNPTYGGNYQQSANNSWAAAIENLSTSNSLSAIDTATITMSHIMEEEDNNIANQSTHSVELVDLDFESTSISASEIIDTATTASEITAGGGIGRGPESFANGEDAVSVRMDEGTGSFIMESTPASTSNTPSSWESLLDSEYSPERFDNNRTFANFAAYLPTDNNNNENEISNLDINYPQNVSTEESEKTYNGCLEGANGAGNEYSVTVAPDNQLLIDGDTWNWNTGNQYIENRGAVPIGRAADQQAAVERAADQQATVERAADQQATVEQAADQQATVEQAADQQATVEQAADQQAAVEQAADQQAAVETLNRGSNIWDSNYVYTDYISIILILGGKWHLVLFLDWMNYHNKLDYFSSERSLKYAIWFAIYNSKFECVEVLKKYNFRDTFAYPYKYKFLDEYEYYRVVRVHNKNIYLKSALYNHVTLDDFKKKFKSLHCSQYTKTILGSDEPYNIFSESFVLDWNADVLYYLQYPKKIILCAVSELCLESSHLYCGSISKIEEQCRIICQRNKIHVMTQLYLLKRREKGNCIRKKCVDKMVARYYFNKSNSVQNECVICFDSLKNGTKVTMLNCNHFLHHECLYEWRKEKNQCPYCRKDIYKTVNMLS
jgi:hypothetical protein